MHPEYYSAQPIEAHFQAAQPILPEAEEYWDDFEDDDLEEEGYVTARSFRSRADLTGNATTTLVMPKLNLKAKKEVAAATSFVESQKTQEELEDEAWDTSMVAEYSEEIFTYMKDLEVW